MRAPRRLDAVLLVLLVPGWIAAFALHVRLVVTGRLAWVPVYVSRPAGPDGPPVVVGFRPGVDPDDTGLRIGDRLVSAGGAELRGVGPVGVFARLADIPIGVMCYRYHALDVERPRLDHLGAWYARLTTRAAFRAHVMLPLSQEL